MRIEGEWGKPDAPYIDAFLSHPGLGIEQAIKFLVDTGASKTHILDNDAARLKIDYSQLTQQEEGTVGIGGVVETYVMPQVTLFFRTHNGKLHEESLKNIFVLNHHLEEMEKEERERIKLLPSILGRDVLNQFKLVLCKADHLVVLTDETSV